ncbi:MAG: chemotaxis-specific protein-glutamate methyltransferase CheB [Planctomycetes bacterium]|nr:chemotaxis-specific protein-glutamate methyltransferase CheB [Planctomycetota bacterium]
MPPHARVLIVDDSRIFRSALEASLTGQEGIEIVGSVFSGQKALEFLQATPADVVTLDVEMPGMDGLETLRAIQRRNAQQTPGGEVGVIMVSAHTKRGADVTVQALRDGAFDFVTKPSGPDADENLAQLRRQLLGKIHQFLASRKRTRGWGGLAAEPPAPSRTPLVAPGRRRQWLQTVPRRAARALAIAASTGGPKALETLLPMLRARTDLPILVVQHMPPKFTLSLAESLARLSGGTVVEAQDGDVIRPEATYIAPGGKHMLLRLDQGRPILGINEQPPENGCRPSADVLFRSAAAVFRGELVAVILTGMGRDGAAGLGAVKRAGGYTLVQDEATSVVWGMPGGAVEAGVVDEVVPLAEIPDAVKQLVAGTDKG